MGRHCYPASTINIAYQIKYALRSIPNMTFETKQPASITVTETLPLLADSNDNSGNNNDYESPAANPLLQEEEAEEEEEENYYIRLSESRIVQHKKANLFKIYVVSLLYFVSFSSSTSSILILTISKICQDLCSYKPLDSAPLLPLFEAMNHTTFRNSNCDSNKAQSINSSMQSMIMFAGALVNIAVAGKVGQLSDKHGRKVMLILCFLVFFVSRCLIALLLSPLLKFSVWLFIGFNLLESLSGGIKSMLGIFRSYVIDLVEPGERISALSIMLGTMFFGFAAGPLINSLVNKLSGGNDFAAVFVSLTGILIAGLFLVFCVPETHFTHNKRLEHQHQHQQQENNSNEMTIFGSIFKVFSSLKLFWIRKTPLNPKPLKKRLSVICLLAIDLITNSSMIATAATVILYCTLKFKWDTVQISYLVSYLGVVRTLQSFIIIPTYMRFMKSRGYLTPEDDHKESLTTIDLLNMRFATACSLIEAVLLVSAKGPAWIYAAVSIGSFSTINPSTIHSSIVKLCHENVVGKPGSRDSKIGELFGAISLVENLSVMFISSTVIMVFSKTASVRANTCFVVVALLMTIAGVLTWFVSSENVKDQFAEEEVADESRY